MSTLLLFFAAHLGVLRIIHGILAHWLTSLAMVLLTVMKVVSIINPRMTWIPPHVSTPQRTLDPCRNADHAKLRQNSRKGTLPSRSSCNDPKLLRDRALPAVSQGRLRQNRKHVDRRSYKQRRSLCTLCTIKYTQHAHKDSYVCKYIHTCMYVHHNCLHTVRWQRWSTYVCRG